MRMPVSDSRVAVSNEAARWTYLHNLHGLSAVALLVLGGAANAQQSKSDETLEFRPHWSLGVQGGAAYTLGEASFAELLSPAAQLSATYHFHHAFGVRAGLSGWQGKGGLVASQDVYKFNYGQLSADFTVDLASLIAGFDHLITHCTNVFHI